MSIPLKQVRQHASQAEALYEKERANISKCLSKCESSSLITAIECLIEKNKIGTDEPFDRLVCCVLRMELARRSMDGLDNILSNY